MSTTSSCGRGTTRINAARQLPTTIWLPAPDEPDAAPAPGSVLPAWAIEKIRTDFTHRPGRMPATLLKISIQDTVPGMDARTPCTTYTDTADDTAGGAPVLLAELHPDALPDPGDDLSPADAAMPGAMENGWPGFLHRAHRLLPADGLLLLAARQLRDRGVLTDPLGSVIACARTAGFRYLQHIVIAHAHPAGDRLVAAPPIDASPGVTHSDLIALSAIHYA
ncbi:hypothetical protein [Wenjunlia tyrosinilytica]|uniref:Uncharacterized protein n=1 Tax=Wenjunlia tyrosinilytica TaxID=1544741 RepID=A0A918E2F0_9ACTN|nr:hypothetical protein [Wenjunlia tyrosinilytica]GGO99336.1 hypothetical protein GCM10012280_65560 [Wenjunlia tyrosinilytica]